ncbi:hypothetical protein [Azospirillum sp. TSO22-1]|uniref:hypothetical protein n=1 Tax=Azospirillum sp. TSO22-1 TaxID=716789 RepID=UPI000D603D7F|nr:hypothetical protein [Azospirillum sp. TSO22-1]PWC55627.1 hypothetical protein TSO221_05000 [Azospirillum sp. TSO22-1]
MQPPAAPQFFETDLFVPTYRPFTGERWELRVVPVGMSPSFWGEPRIVRDMAVLLRQGSKGMDTWMSMTPFETESQEIGCRLATGHTVVMGMGMGWAAANAALRPAVSRVTIVERDPEVIGLIRDTGIFDQLLTDAAAKIAIVQADALEWRSEAPVDTLLADIWLRLNGDDRVDHVRTMRANTGAPRVYFWGQEMVLARRARDTGRVLDDASLTAIVGEIGLPLIGPEWPSYAALAAQAAARWLTDE